MLSHDIMVSTHGKTDGSRLSVFLVILFRRKYTAHHRPPPPNHPFHPHLRPPNNPHRPRHRLPPALPLLLQRPKLPHHPLNPITPHLERLHPRPVREPHKVMTRTIKQIPAPGRVEVKEDAGHDNHLFVQTRLEEVEAVRDRPRQALEVEPQVERRVRHELDGEAHVAQALHDVVALGAEVVLEGDHFLLHERGVEHGDGGFLEGDVGAAVEVAPARADAMGGELVGWLRGDGRGDERLDEFLGAEDPRDAPAGEAEALGEAVDNEDVVFVDVDDVLRGADGGAVAVAGVVVARVELVRDEGGALAADVLDLGQLGVGDDAAGGVPRVGGEDDAGAAGDFLGNLFGVDVVAVFFGQGDRDGGEL